jgi:tetratricopeptide (TPR) repeat protein
MLYQIGYYPHNMHFKALSASLEGRRADAMQAAQATQDRMHADMLRDPDMGGMVQHMRLTPLYIKIRFGMWDDVLSEPEPPADAPFMQAIWHAARGMAYVAKGQLAEAEAERVLVETLKAAPGLEQVWVSSVNRSSSVAAVAFEVLAGQLAAARTRGAEAARHLARAVELEDGLTYMEPPDWFVPVRQIQGAALLDLGRLTEAEAAFRGDLRKFPDNGWSLSGLQASLERQGRHEEAAAVKARLDAAWSRADVTLAAGRVR